MPDLKPELSAKSKYWIPRHRYYELKHYCMQYPYWKRLYYSLEFKMGPRDGVRSSEPGKPTEVVAIARAECKNAMERVEQCCRESFPELYDILLRGVTEGLSYEVLRCKDEIPCSKDMYYDRYRKFFYILSQKRGI